MPTFLYHCEKFKSKYCNSQHSHIPSKSQRNSIKFNSKNPFPRYRRNPNKTTQQKKAHAVTKENMNVNFKIKPVQRRSEERRIGKWKHINPMWKKKLNSATYSFAEWSKWNEWNQYIFFIITLCSHFLWFWYINGLYPSEWSLNAYFA